MIVMFTSFIRFQSSLLKSLSTLSCTKRNPKFRIIPSMTTMNYRSIRCIRQDVTLLDRCFQRRQQRQEQRHDTIVNRCFCILNSTSNCCKKKYGITAILSFHPKLNAQKYFKYSSTTTNDHDALDTNSNEANDLVSDEEDFDPEEEEERSRAMQEEELERLNQENDEEEDDDIIEMQIPGRESDMILVSDDLFQKIEQNTATVMHKQHNNVSSKEKRHYTLFDNDGLPFVQSIPPILTKAGEEAYFQFDYRNHPPITKQDSINLLYKIERTLKNIHEEPLGFLNRGVGTVQKNINKLQDYEDYRYSRKSFSKYGTFQPMKSEKPKISRYTLLKTLTERHSLYITGGNNPRFGSLKPIVYGQGFYGMDTHIEMKSKMAEVIIRDLWCYGTNPVFDAYQKKHNAMLQRRAEKKAKLKLKEEMKTMSYPLPLVQKGKGDAMITIENIPLQPEQGKKRTVVDTKIMRNKKRNKEQ